MKKLVIRLVITGALMMVAFVAVKRSSSPKVLPRDFVSGSMARETAVNSPSPQSGISALAKVETNNVLSAATAFSNWAEQFLTGNATNSMAQGEALAWKRREMMLELIEFNPEKAIALAAPYRWRQKLPANITRHFEQWVDGRGELNVAVATDFDQGATRVYRNAEIGGQAYRAFVYGRRQKQVSQKQIPLHGIMLDRKLAVLPDAVRILESAEAEALEKERGQAAEKICGVSGKAADFREQRVAVEIGGEVRYFCGADHVKLVNEQLAKNDGGNGGGQASAIFDSWTHGSKNILYMRVNFPDDLTEPISEAQAYNVMDSANDFYSEGSYNLTSLSTMVTPLLTLPQTKNWYSTAGPFALMTDAREKARQAGFETAGYPLDIVAFTSVPDFKFGGLGAVYGKGTWLQSTGVGVTAHELGHNYGLWHANFWDAITNNGVITSGTNFEYGNIFDTMGRASAGNNQFNAAHKNILNWLTDPAVQHVTSNGVYRIYPFDAPNRVDGRFYAARIPKDAFRDYWVEFRQKFTANPWLQNGVLLNWSPWDESNGGAQLLDTTPGTPTPSNSREDAAVVIGRTFSDTAAGVHITPVARGSTGPNIWMDVQFNFGALPTNHPPFMQVEIDPTNAAPGAIVHFHATALDPDGDALAYAWNFDNLEFSTNNLPRTSRSWTTPGDYVVRCQVSDMKGGVASTNTIVTIGSRQGYRIKGRVTDAKGDPVEGVRVDNGATDSSYLGGYTDSDGGYVIVGVTSGFTLNAFKYGFTFTTPSWTNPITVTNDVENADFLAKPLPVITITANTNATAENNPATNYFTLSRTGEITNDLSVTLYLSGTAGISSDYTMIPALASGSNNIIIPSNVVKVSFAVQVVNDSSIEGTETIVATVMDEYIPTAIPSYVVGHPGEATIAILDNDLPVKPAVSVVATTPTIPENGMDGGTLLFRRTGGTDNDLTVFYTIGGSATPGVDYTSLLGAVLIPAGSDHTIIQFQTRDDKNVESNETVIVTITTNVAYTISGLSDQVEIIDDDLLTVTVFPTGENMAEPSSSGTFTVKREGDISGNLVVYYSLSGSATAGADYLAPSGSVTIPAGRTSADILLTAQDDNILEGDESVVLTLTTNASYNIGIAGVATIYIHDDEKTSVTVTALDPTASEPGTDMGSFVISRGSVVNGDLTVFLAISGTAISGVDYVPLENPVVIPDGANSVTLDVIVFDDLHQEPTENIILNVVQTTNYNAGSPSQARVSILDDDANNVPAVGFTFSASSAEESKSPGVSFSLSATSSVPVTVNYRVIGGTASSNDYTLIVAPLTFNPGERAKSIVLQINNDTNIEPNETIRLVLFDPSNATLDGIKFHTYTILDDDASSVSITATSPSTSETGSSPGNFRISRSGQTNAPLLVTFEVVGTASAPSDYAPLGTSATIPAGAAFVDLPVVAVNDKTVEFIETVKLTLLTAPTAKIVSPNKATVTINDNDADTLPVVAVTSTNKPFAVEGGGNGEFLFTREGTNGALTLNFSITGGANNGTDCITLPTSVIISNGNSSVTLPVVAMDDTVIEGEETLVVTLTLSDTYRVAYPSTATVTIQDNDQRVSIDASDFVATEPGRDTGEVTFTRFGTTNTPLQVYFTISGTAGNGLDYIAISNSFTIPAGSLFAKLPIIPLDDTLREGPEFMKITLVSNSAYSIVGNSTGVVTINDNEPMLSIVSTITNITEGSKPSAAFRITRTGDPGYDFTARLAVSGTASYGVDYPPFATNVYFACGIATIDLLVSPTNEMVIETVETVIASLLPDAAYTILTPNNALINIADAGTNRAPIINITSPATDMVFLLGTNAGLVLEATVFDNNANTNSPTMINWSRISGPDTMSFEFTNQNNTTALFTNGGVYVLRITASNNILQSFADVTVVVDAINRFSTNLLHWSFDDGSGTSVLDTSTNRHNGLVVGTPNWITNGVTGGALGFSGTNNHVLEATNSGFLDGLKQFSLSLWVNTALSNSNQGIFSADETGTNATLALYTRTQASCGSQSNVLEAVIPSSRGLVVVHSTNLVAGDWQHIALTWSNGLAPVLFVNGKVDQPLSQFFVLDGTLDHCPQFMVGKDPVNSPASWNGFMDDVRVFPNALNAAEVGALVTTNYGAVVDAGSNLTVQVISPGVLVGVIIDDGRPKPPGILTNTWILASGPAPVTITNGSNFTCTVGFTVPGDYVMRLIADDGQVKTFDDVKVLVIEPTVVDVSASDPDASEFGPDKGQFTFQRRSNTNFDLTISFAMSGIASNIVDFIELPSSVTLPEGIQSVVLDVIPYLDDRTEGDEPFTLTIISNAAYTVGNSQATVVIHDSPYGVWNIAHFSLEELTDPALSGELADFDHDGLSNFAEYAANRDPKVAETTRPLTTALELNSTNGLKYITLVYPRRIPPTDVAYEPVLSTDLSIWNTGTNYIEEIQTTDDGNTLTETVKARVVAPWSTRTNQFSTIRVWLRTTGP